MCIQRIDVVIPVKNEAFKLQCCCKHIRKYLPVNNLIIVVSPSKDNTFQVAKDYGNIVIQDENKGVGCARAIGLEKVKTKYFASIDADIIVQRARLRYKKASSCSS
ncbi:glycosyltransferase family 2 protein [Candidatus Bathyarchaeota archaeon]|nr:glycosyltransferase family 2 protein [Candidatus Bathyarchaeota archaeon]